MSIYNSIYSILETYIFGTIELGSFQELVCIFFSTGLALSAVLIPCWAIFKVIGGVFDLCR